MVVCRAVVVAVVLCGVVGPPAVRGAQGGKNDLERLLGKSNASVRFDSKVDPPTTFTVASGSVQSKLFGHCKAQADTAQARFREINFSNGQYTRYVPSDQQRNTYDPDWAKVTSVRINNVIECSAWANTNNAMMFKYDESGCSVSDLRLSMSSPKCGDRTAKAYFVRTSCPEPTVTSVTLANGTSGMDVFWKVQDPCNLATKYRVFWQGGSYDTTDTSMKQHTVTGLTGCQSVAFTVVALDSVGAPFGASKTELDTTNTQAPTIENVTVVATGIVTFDVSWDLDDPCNAVKSFSLAYKNGAADTSPTTGTAAVEDRTASKALSDCTDLVVEVNGLDGQGNTVASDTSDPSIPLHSAQCKNGFDDICSGCFFQATWNSSYSASVSYCTDLESTAIHLTAADYDEFEALRTFLDTEYDGSERRFWVDLHKLSNGIWTFSAGYEPVTSDWFGTEPNNPGVSCAYMIRGANNYHIGDIDCLGQLNYAYGMCYYN